MDSFLLKFFPSVYRKKHNTESTNQYCQYDSQKLTMFTSSLYLAALISSIVASGVTRRFGRKLSMFFGGLLFCFGAVLNAGATHVWMLIVGRILLGFGIGFSNQVWISLLYLDLGLQICLLGFLFVFLFWIEIYFLFFCICLIFLCFCFFTIQVVRQKQGMCYLKIKIKKL